MPTSTAHLRCSVAWRLLLLFAAALTGSLGAVVLLPAWGRTQESGQKNTDSDQKRLPKTIEWVVPEGLETPPQLRFDGPFQQGNRCGPNALFILLRLLDKPVTYEGLLDRLPIGDLGCTLEDLQREGTRCGVRMEVRRLTPEELRTAPKPLIIHIKSPVAAPGKKAPTGHFTVVTRAGPGDYLVGVDTSNALMTTFSSQYLARNFSGYALVPDTTRTWMWSREGFVYLTLLVGEVVVNLGALAGLRKRNQSTPGHVGTARPEG